MKKLNNFLQFWRSYVLNSIDPSLKHPSIGVNSPSFKRSIINRERYLYVCKLELRKNKRKTIEQKSLVNKSWREVKYAGLHKNVYSSVIPSDNSHWYRVKLGHLYLWSKRIGKMGRSVPWERIGIALAWSWCTQNSNPLKGKTLKYILIRHIRWSPKTCECKIITHKLGKVSTTTL